MLRQGGKAIKTKLPSSMHKGPMDRFLIKSSTASNDDENSLRPPPTSPTKAGALPLSSSHNIVSPVKTETSAVAIDGDDWMLESDEDERVPAPRQRLKRPQSTSKASGREEMKPSHAPAPVPLNKEKKRKVAPALLEDVDDGEEVNAGRGKPVASGTVKELVGVIDELCRTTTREYLLSRKHAPGIVYDLLSMRFNTPELRLIEQRLRSGQLSPHELDLSTNLDQKGIYIRCHLFNQSKAALEVLSSLSHIVYAVALSSQIRSVRRAGEPVSICYVGKEEASTIAERMNQHESGHSGATLEAPLSVGARGRQSDMLCAVVFEEDHLLKAARLHSLREKIPLDKALGVVTNVGEALACALFRTHVADSAQGSIGGSNCTAGGQVFGPASLRMNTLINNLRHAYTDNPKLIEEKLNEPAIEHVTTDNGLMELVVIVSKAKQLSALEDLTVCHLQSAIQSSAGVTYKVRDETGEETGEVLLGTAAFSAKADASQLKQGLDIVNKDQKLKAEVQAMPEEQRKKKIKSLAQSRNGTNSGFAQRLANGVPSAKIEETRSKNSASGLTGKGKDAKHQWLIDITANVNGKVVRMLDKKVNHNGWGSEPDLENCLGYLQSTAELVKTICEALDITREDFIERFSANKFGQCKLSAIRDRADKNGLNITFAATNKSPVA